MRTIKYIFSFIALALFLGCSEDDNDLSFVDKVTAPINVSALFQPTQNNSGIVTIIPNSEGGVSYNITLGDGSEPVSIDSGEKIEKVYAEGNYSVEVEAVGLTGLKTSITQDLVVSFKAPENLVITIENDAAISKQVNVTATADFAMSYQVYFGELGTDDPVLANIGEVASFNYQDAGTYTIRIVAMGSAIATTEYTEEFEVTAILQPLAPAMTPRFREASDVISIYSASYTNVPSNLFPDWGQTGNFGSTWGEFELNGDMMLQYTNLSYQGLDITTPIDATSQEYLHIDVWSAEVTSIDVFPLPDGVAAADERFISLSLAANQWNSFDIPLSDFTDQGLPIDNLKQFKFTQTNSDDWGAGTVFVDNLYFWKEPSTYTPLLFDDFEGAGNITTWLGDAAGLNTAFANPYVNADNFSPTVLEYDDAGGQYANVQFVASSKFDLSGGNSVFTFKIYVPSSSITGGQTNQISLKLQNSDLGGNSWQTQTEIIKPIVLDEWQELIFDFGSDPFVNLDAGSPDPVNRTDLDKVVLQLNSENNNDLVKAYVDDFKYGTTPPSDFAPFARDGFEGFGTITTWAGDAAGLNTALANPFVGANNNSATVLEYSDTGGQYANVQFTVTPVFDLTSKNKFTLKIYVPSSSITGSQTNQISLKLQNSSLGGNSWQTQTEIVKSLVLDQWQELTFDFANDPFINLDANSPNPIDRTDLDKVVLQLNSENNNDEVSAYIDDFNYHN
jgi:hypothetical protein